MARNVMNQCGTRDEQRPFLREPAQVKQRHRPAGGAEKHEIAARTENAEILIEGSLADTVVNDVNSLSFGEALGLGLKILLRVKNHFIRAGFARKFGFFLGAYRGDHPGPD